MVISAARAGVLLHTASAAMRARRTTSVRSMTSSRCFCCYLLYEIRLINLLASGDSVSSVAAVYDRRRCLNCCTVGAHRAPLQLGNPAIFKLSHYLLASLLVDAHRETLRVMLRSGW